MSQFKDKVIWITGASSGIGEALALQLAKEGARLILSARREEELKRVGKLTNLPDLDLMILPFDLDSTSNATGLAAQILNKFGRIDILINNGGQSQRAEALQTTEETERHLMEVNYFSQVNLAKAVLPYMIRQKTGHVVVISSVAGKFGFYLRSTYSAAKHALHGYFETLRLETESKGIKILMVCPGKVRTNISYNATLGKGESHGKMDESHDKAMGPDECAKQIIVGIRNNEEEIFIGGKELKAITLRRFFPKYFWNIIRKQNPY